MASENILIREITPEELKAIIQELIHKEFQQINIEIQNVIGEVDLISIGTACLYNGCLFKSISHTCFQWSFYSFSLHCISSNKSGLIGKIFKLAPRSLKLFNYKTKLKRFRKYN